ncbi:MAG: DUF4132 domain-containing protein [Anaerolineae bacterium]|nr:DUF4132 domain-containing protein [Anaerolineae bacterium]
MFNFIKSAFSHTAAGSEAEALVEELARQNVRQYPFDLKNFTAGVKFLNADPETQRTIVLAMLAWLEKYPFKTYPQNQHDQKAWQVGWQMLEAFLQMLKRKLPFDEQDIIAMLNWSAGHSSGPLHMYLRGVPQIIKVLGDYLKDHPISDEIYKVIERLIRSIESEHMSVENRKWVLRLKELRGDTEVNLPLMAGDIWADAALSELRALDSKSQTAWAELLLHCLRVTGSAPRSKWLKGMDKYLDIIGISNFFTSLLRWFPLVDKPRATPAYRYDHLQTPLPVNADILKGLAWLCSKSDNPESARALAGLAVSAYKKIPGSGPRAGKVGNACFWTLGNMPGSEGVAQLSILKIKIKTNTAQKLIASALETAARRLGMTAEDIEEMSVPMYGLEEIGLRRDDFGEVVSELRVDGSEVEQVWVRNDAKRLSSAPKAIKEKYPEELKEINQAVKDIRKMLPAQRDRIDNLYLMQKKWTFASWQARYLNHPLVGTVARRLIWKFIKADKAASGIWSDGRMVGRDNQPIDWIDDSTTVELWHPINVESDVVLEWRGWLMEHEIRQPFKQAYREVYLLTDAERNTRVYSNRYAAHILRQHQFNSLCAAKGWKNALRLLVDAEFPPARKTLPQWGLRAEYWIEGIGDNYGGDTNETGTFLYLTTDQVRFYRIDANENQAHGYGGGYAARRWGGQGIAEPLPLEEIPPLVFSEIMRDVDMFVGVASIGNDPNWLDGGPEVRYRDYWHSYSFGELTESSKTRKQVLQTLLPRLKISERCKLTDKFLVVRGDIRTYKIHLGSGNILMEPNDQYLCIVPSRRSGEMGKDKLFIPFEGDQTLAIILSKAFLLADDKKISDPSITRQIKR